MSIPVICDRCRQVGIAGEADFSHLGDLLEFEPVPRRQRVNGWDPDAQRAFVALLAVTGSKRQAALAIGRNSYGVDQLLKSPDSDSFKAACERALAIARQNGAMKLAQGVADAAARNAQLTPPSRLRGHAPELPPPLPDGRRRELMQEVGLKLLRKVAQERSARLAGDVVAADFYLRQITLLEVALDLAATSESGDAHDLLAEFRRGDHQLLDVAATRFSESLDRARRAWWRQEGDPERPAHPDPRLLEWHASDDGDYATSPGDQACGPRTPPARGYSAEQWAALDVAGQQAARARQRDEDSAAQVEWERRAVAEWQRRQASPSPPCGGRGPTRAKRERGEGAEREDDQ